MTKKVNFNLPVDENTANEFEKWHEELPGQKGEKLTGALKAIMAIHSINPGLAFQLMNPKISIEEAKAIIIKEITGLSPDMSEQVFRQKVLSILKEVQAIPSERQHGRRANSAKSG